MRIGDFALSPEAHVLDVFNAGRKFSVDDRDVGEFDRSLCEKAYADAVKARMQVRGYKHLTTTSYSDSFTVSGFNAAESKFVLSFSVTDQMGLKVNYGRGENAVHGSVALDWFFWDFESDFDYDDLEAFVDHFKEW
jgi:hypothetical protein